MTVVNDPHNAVNGSHAVKRQPSHVDGFGTRAIHVGSDPDPKTGAVIPPISLATTYKQDGVGNHKGFEYARSGNPNRNALEAMLASLEGGGAHAIAFASGSAATATMVQAVGPGAHVLCVNDVYGGTFRYLRRVAEEMQGLETSFVDLEGVDDEAVAAALRRNTKLVWIETPTNPTLRLVDISRLVSLAHASPSRPLVVVDNTFLSPFYQAPLLLGADVVAHSLSKYVNGHTDVIMGALVLPARHAALERRLRFLQNAHGAVPSPYDCWLAQRSAKTLHLRMKAHGLNALRVARALARSAYVEEVIYPGLATHARHGLAYHQVAPHAKTFVDAHANEGGFPYGGMVSFRIRGGAREANAFLTATRLFSLAESLGGVESLAEVPAQMTHASIPEVERVALGIGENLIRLSVGVEEGEDLVRDVEQALEVAVLGCAEERN